MKHRLLPFLSLLLLATRLSAAEPPHVVFMIGEKEYQTHETLPAWARAELESAGLRCTFVHADETDPNSFPGLGALKSADVLVLSVRRRTLSVEQMGLVREHFKSGKGLVALRTTSHAFELRNGPPPSGHVEWKGFDTEVLGGDYQNHYANKEGTDISTLPHSIRDPLLTGVKATTWHSDGTLYRSRDLAGNTTVLLRGLAQDKGQPVIEPVAWYRTHGKSRIFYTSLGHPGDFEQSAFKRMLFNAVHWALKKPIPGASAEASLQHSKERDKLDLDNAGNARVKEIMKTFAGRGEVGDHSLPTPAAEAVKQFQIQDGFEIEVIAHEPEVRQPLFITFDGRGRLWVVQYLQYPMPAGLKVIRYDQYLRAVFDKVPAPPPNHTKGADKITVFEDTNGDGQYDSSKDVITGLNIVSSLAIGRGGIWVLNPPYLLFYPDRNGDDVPDGDPEVHLRGFGLEDTHSVANSLRFGPDGWLYGANGSTTTASISSAATSNVQFKGQCIWRYHPGTKVFEVYAEGGGNTFSVEIDAEGRVYSGTNNGNTHGMHYAQGGYARKNWGKHGPLTNPYAFGFYEHMRHEGFRERFSQAFAIYDGGAFPAPYRHVVIGANALHNRVVPSKLLRDTSTWRTEDYAPLVITADRWFRPVDVKVGPDGAVYLADWYDSRLTHVDPRDNWHKGSGRIYRVKAKGSAPMKPFNLDQLSSPELVGITQQHANKWWRHEALRVLGDRRDAGVLPQLRKILASDASARALEALMAIPLCGTLTEQDTLTALESKHAAVRRWAARQVGDAGEASPQVAARLAGLAVSEGDAEVRSQLAATARRLPAVPGLAVVRQLLARDSDLEDLHIPLMLWWAVEAKTVSDRDAILQMMRDDGIWELPIVKEHITSRLMKRYAMAGTPADLQTCAKLLELAPDNGHRHLLMAGLLEAFQGREIRNLPPELASALDEYQHSLGASGLAVALRRGDGKALDQALKIVADSGADMATRLTTIEILGQIAQPKVIPTLTRLLRTTGANAINLAALKALANYPDDSIGRSILGSYHSSLLEEHGVRQTANRVLASRQAWARAFLGEIDAWKIKSDTVPLDVVQQMRLHDDAAINELIEKHWGRIRGATPAEKQEQMQRVERIVRTRRAEADLIAGKQLFTTLCAQCHTLFDEGGHVGPELTGYERDNLDFMLLAVVDPSAAIREEFTNFILETKDGRNLTGLIDKQDTRTVTLRGVDGQDTLVPRDQIKSLQASPLSIMPEGLAEAMTDEQIRDLFGYVMSRTPPKTLGKAP